MLAGMVDGLSSRAVEEVDCPETDLASVALLAEA